VRLLGFLLRLVEREPIERRGRIVRVVVFVPAFLDAED
jgi:hypothetical protein